MALVCNVEALPDSEGWNWILTWFGGRGIAAPILLRSTHFAQ